MPISKKYSHDQLVRMLKNHHPEAYRYLYQAYSGQLYFLILFIVKSPEQSLEVLQDVFVKIWKSIGTYEHHGLFFTWMIMIVRTTSLDAIKKKDYRNRRLNVNIEENLTMVPAEPFNSDGIGIYDCVKHLPGDYKTLIMLSYFDGFTHQQISRILDMPMGTVKSKLRRAIRQLKAFLS